MNKIEFGIMAVFIVAMTQVASASALVINPSDDGLIDDDGDVSNDSYFITYGPKRAVIEFPTDQISRPIEEAYLSVNPYALPLRDYTIEVYGYESNDGILTSLDYDAGNFIGILYLPEDIDFGEDAYMNVTGFLRGISTPFVGFNLRSEPGKADVFSSLEINYDHSSQLLISPIPEPSTIILILAGLSLIGLKAKINR
jgi:hypothetical protein